MSRRYTVACLAGNGVGPELMAEASRALAAVTRLHGLTVEEVHVPFGSEAFVRMGHPLPASTRQAYRGADAVLVAGDDPALDGVEADLDLRSGLVRVVAPGHADLAVVFPLGVDIGEWTTEQAFELACARRGRIAIVGAHVAGLSERWPGLEIEALSSSRATVRRLAVEPECFDVVLAQRALADALAHVAAFGARGRLLAFGRLSPSGPGVFFPDHPAADDAGQGTADPGSVLLAAALTLGEGLGERAAAWTLERAIAAAAQGGRGPRTRATTRERTDAVLAELTSTVATAEFSWEPAA